MPLSKLRDRERKRKSRLDKRLCPPVEINPVQPKIVPNTDLPWWDRPGLPVMDVQALDIELPVQPEVYNPTKRYEAGTKVLMYRGKRLIETVIPELDADGQPVPDLQ